MQLWDSYGDLLTENRREICELYYGLDLSLSEIAEQKGVSRQSVSETLRKSREQLDFYDKKLRRGSQDGEDSVRVSCLMADVINALEKFKQFHPEFSREMDEILEMVVVGGNGGPDGEN